MVCHKCGADNVPNAKFCKYCGAKFNIPGNSNSSNNRSRVCSNCGTELQPGWIFCGKCGNSIQPQSGSRPGRNRNRSSKKPLIIILIVVIAVIVVGFLFITKSGIINISHSDNDNTATVFSNNSNRSIDYDFSDAMVGDEIQFGAYEQDNNTINGTEMIDWIVLAREDDKILVISKYALDCQQYNTTYVPSTWETCSLRTWLNDTFLNAAFNNKESAMIATTTVSAELNQHSDADAGNDTQDQIFLLSISEANQYFDSDDARKCVPTAYAIAQGSFSSDKYSTDGNANCWWWLRSPGDNNYNAVGVRTGGNLNYEGNLVDCVHDSVRPAMWIEL